jgi:hypothetical protein
MPEWRSFVDWMADRRSGLLLIQGEPGSGRTHLLGSFGVHAKDQGYRVAGCSEQLPIESTTQISDITRALTALLEVETRVADVGHDASSLLHEGLHEDEDEENHLYAVLEQAGSLLIGVDGYSPSSDLEKWIRGSLLGWIKEAKSSVVLVLVDRPERLEGIREKADLVLALGALDRDELREHFTSVSASLEPPLSSDEVESYTEAASADPNIFRALNTVLLATAQRGRA